jgi:predicted nucleic acid-binding Zn ribbon protein
MDTLFQSLICSIIGVILLWFGYTLFCRFRKDRQEVVAYKSDGIRSRSQSGPQVESGKPGNPRVCPVCAAKLEHGERVKSDAFPGIPGQGRLMHIWGCVYCLDGSRKRLCPVCGASIRTDQMLVARMFEKPGHSHVHVLGCGHCREALAGSR